MAEKIRESVIAGSWYPGDPGKLKKQISGYLDRANPPRIEGQLVGLIAPHAGYMYSGGVAAHGYKLLFQTPFDRILILAPSHHAHFDGSSIYNLGGYRTPLGIVPLDLEIIEDLFRYPSLVGYVPGADQQEHSLEIQLPFLQTVVPGFSLVPVIMGDQSYDHCLKLADAIASVCEGRRVLMVASTDLSHYYPYEEARRLDKVFLGRIEAFDPDGLAGDIGRDRCQACGAGPVLTLMLAAKRLGADTGKVLHYANSGDITGERTSGVVGYTSAAFYRKTEDREKPEDNSRKAGTDLGYTPEEKETLRETAYRAIRCRCLGEPMPEIPAASTRLREPRGAFVCIHKEGELRGCIGMIEARESLHETIRNMAIEAAFGDPRFCALAPDEIDKIDIEISVLTPLQRIRNVSGIEIGKHGLFIRKGFHSGLLLPQVAVEHGWSQAQFLAWTCKKAGLPKDAWEEPDTEIYTFSADIF